MFSLSEKKLKLWNFVRQQFLNRIQTFQRQIIIRGFATYLTSYFSNSVGFLDYRREPILSC